MRGILSILKVGNIGNMPKLILVVSRLKKYRIADLLVFLAQMAVAHMALQSFPH